MTQKLMDVAHLVMAINSLEKTLTNVGFKNTVKGSKMESSSGGGEDAFGEEMEFYAASLGHGRPEDKRTVYVRVVFLKLGEIDTVKQKYSADVLVQGRWEEPTLHNKQQQAMDADSLDWDKDYWNPRIQVSNALGGTKSEVWRKVDFDSEGRATVREKKRVQGAFLEYLELNQFPFDTQDLTITVSTTRGEHELDLVEDLEEPSRVNVESFIGEQEWQLHTATHSWRKETTKVFKSTHHKHPGLSVAIKASRRPGFFVWNVLFVMMLLGTMSFSIFSVDISLIANRLQLSFILLLTTVTFKFVVTQNLPKIAYLTYLDKYILCSMGFLMSLAVWHVIAFQLYDRNESPANIASADRTDFYAFWVLLICWLAFQVTFIAWILHVVKQNKKFSEKPPHQCKEEEIFKPGEGNQNNNVADSQGPSKSKDLAGNLTANDTKGKKGVPGPGGPRSYSVDNDGTDESHLTVVATSTWHG